MPRRIGLLLALASLLLLGGCATLGARNGIPTRGLVRLATDDTPLSLDTQGVVRTLGGPRALVDQFARLGGAVVDVWGTVGPARIRATDFEIVDAGDGQRPLVGFVIVDQMGIWLEDSVTGTRLALRGDALSDLRALHAARVWMSGTIVGRQQFLIAHWGLLAPPPSASE